MRGNSQVKASPWAVALVGCALLLLVGPAASAPGVALAGTMGDKVVLVIDGRTRVLSLGETVDGVRVQRGAGERSVVVEAGGYRQALVVGAAPVAVGDAQALRAGRQRPVLVLEAGSDRIYQTGGEINGHAMQAVVDTGASVVVLSVQTAQRMGVDWQAGTAAQVQTASGRSAGRRVRLAQVRLGPLQARDVEAVVIDSDMPHVLVGNSFLQGFRLQWEQGRLSMSP
jgi:aspartyl protease family protein